VAAFFATVPGRNGAIRMKGKGKNREEQGRPRVKRGRPPKISRDDIISASLRTKTDLTLKSVADDLRVTPQALYRYVRGLGDILQMVIEKLRDDYPFPADTGQDWFSFAYDTAHVLRHFYLAIPGLAEYAMNTPMLIPSVLSGYEKSLVIARRQGFDEVAGYFATQAYIELVYTWVAREQRRGAMTAASGKSAAELLLERLDKPDVDFPLLQHALRKAEPATSDERFDLRLRWLLTGIAKDNGMTIALPATPMRVKPVPPSTKTSAAKGTAKKKVT
jgi:hypothetical protein